MKTITSQTILLLSTVIRLTHALYECNATNAIPVANLLPSPPSGGSSGGVVSPGITVPSTGSCNSFWIAVGGECAPAKAKRRAILYNALPCYDNMACVFAGANLGCLDISTMNYIADDGTCGNWNTGEEQEGCVEQILKEAGVGTDASATSGGVAATGTSGGGLLATGTVTGARASSTAAGSSTLSTSGSNGVVAASQNGAANFGHAWLPVLAALAAAMTKVLS
jgi:hypothetical protein